MVAGLADLPAGERGDLIRADDQRIAAARGHGAGLGLGQSQGGAGRRFVRQGCFIDGWHVDVERHAQPLEQCAPVRGAGSENQPARGD